jgi:hypothetical protein
MVPEYIIFRYSCEYRALSKHHVSPYLILLTRKELVKKAFSFPQKRLTKRRIRLFQTLFLTTKESLCLGSVIEKESASERFQELCKALREYTGLDDFKIIYYHEF